MEILIAIIIVITLALSANRLYEQRGRSRYDPLPKPTVSISRTYKEDPADPKK